MFVKIRNLYETIILSIVITINCIDYCQYSNFFLCIQIFKSFLNLLKRIVHKNQNCCLIFYQLSSLFPTLSSSQNIQNVAMISTQLKRIPRKDQTCCLRFLLIVKFVTKCLVCKIFSMLQRFHVS